MQFSRLMIGSLLALASLPGLVPAAVAARPPFGPPTVAEEFVQACTTRLDLTEEQRSGLRAYLEQEINYMNVQAANHTAAEVAELIPIERAQLQLVAGHLLSPGQLRQFRELEATPQMKAYLKQMSLGD